MLGFLKRRYIAQLEEEVTRQTERANRFQRESLIWKEQNRHLQHSNNKRKQQNKTLRAEVKKYKPKEAYEAERRAFEQRNATDKSEKVAPFKNMG